MRSIHRQVAFAVLAGLLFTATLTAQQDADPAEALAGALAAACRQEQAAFARFLTVDNAKAYSDLPEGPKKAILQRMVQREEAGRVLRSNDAEGRTVLRCESSSATTEMRFGTPRLRENLAFIPLEVRLAAAAGEPFEGRRVEFGLVWEGRGWKLLSVGLLLIDIPAWAEQWARSDLAAREAAAVATLRRLAEAVRTYHEAYGRLPESLSVLGPAPKEGVSPEAASLVDSELATGAKGGYAFRYRILPAPEGGPAGFEVAATPVAYPKNGRMSYFLDATGVLRGGDKQGAVASITDPRIETR